MPLAYRTILTINNYLDTDLHDVDTKIRSGTICSVLPDLIKAGTQQEICICAPSHFAGSSGAILYKTYNHAKQCDEKLAFEFKCVNEEANFVKFSSSMPEQIGIRIDPYTPTDHPLYG
ncbi:hypothetical protein BGW36DRAFT_358762 [Talaromyces proteolyticus]|uniref:Uncharacterized protein n=1 Tax=Talaromyces proteolyticus TaxID=1131652 RepID=A0AAD4KZA3_9EURO|nr:uncharacterized protein BGW36DRAFT_358762 [Talaromyces proteolyticus]KAH8699261.1 hypothetical protein BGW36DRAFT_358762 [Talaromyces proteolyticus]